MESVFRPTERPFSDPGTLPDGGEHSPWSRGPDGRFEWPLGCPGGERGPRFDLRVGPDGYAWWYVDAVSEDGEHSLTLIAFVGSVFSPFYAEARRFAPADPQDFCAMNVALYGRTPRWVFTEHPRESIRRDATTFKIGPNRLSWRGDTLHIFVDDTSTPFGRPVRGEIRITPRAFNRRAFALDISGRHRWWPIAPYADIEVELCCPALRWRGRAYLDSNHGDEPLEKAFRGWNWSRSTLAGSTIVNYVTDALDGSRRHLAFEFDEGGDAMPCEQASPTPLRGSLWRVAREVVDEGARKPRVVETFEDTPFYTRQRIEHTLRGKSVEAVHESLDLQRFSKRWVQRLLPARTKRI